MSTIGGFIIMFFTMIFMMTTIVVLFNSIVEGNQAISEQQNRDLERIETSITISNLEYFRLGGTDRTVIEITNDGKRKLDVKDIDIYYDEIRITRGDVIRTEAFKSPNIINPLHFDPGEIYQINISMDRENGTHIVTASTEYGVVATHQFTYG